MEDSPIATVEEGQLQGKLAHSPSGKAFYSFQGIPYAKPPIGSLRFKVSRLPPYFSPLVIVSPKLRYAVLLIDKTRDMLH